MVTCFTTGGMYPSSQAACDAYLLADKEPMADIPWPGAAKDGAGGSSITKPNADRYYSKE